MSFQFWMCWELSSDGLIEIFFSQEDCKLDNDWCFEEITVQRIGFYTCSYYICDHLTISFSE